MCRTDPLVAAVVLSVAAHAAVLYLLSPPAPVRLEAEVLRQPNTLKVRWSEETGRQALAQPAQPSLTAQPGPAQLQAVGAVLPPTGAASLATASGAALASAEVTEGEWRGAIEPGTIQSQDTPVVDPRATQASSAGGEPVPPQRVAPYASGLFTRHLRPVPPGRGGAVPASNNAMPGFGGGAEPHLTDSRNLDIASGHADTLCSAAGGQRLCATPAPGAAGWDTP